MSRNFLLVVIMGVSSAALGADVAPGSVVKWSGEAIDSCRLGNADLQPYEGACWYPIDLLTETGLVVVERVIDGVRQTRQLRVGEYPYPEQHLQVEDSTVHLATADAQRAAEEKTRIDAIWHRPEETHFSLPLALPIAGAEQGRSFGARRILNGEPRSPHSGIDFRAAHGTPVRSVAAGRVVLAEEHFFGGRSVFIDHGGELISMYMHLHRIDVEEGQLVDRGQLIGTVGATGRATGPHLHFGLRWHGARIDPAFLFQPESVGLVPVLSEADVDHEGDFELDR